MINKFRTIFSGLEERFGYHQIDTSSGDGKGSVMDNNARVGDKVIIECADLTTEINEALAEYNQEGGG